MKLHLEILNHFSCDKCGYWWSIASVRLELGNQVYCPWCGYQNLISEIELGGNLDFGTATTSDGGTATGGEG